jgi:hypothetical protein
MGLSLLLIPDALVFHPLRGYFSVSPRVVTWETALPFPKGRDGGHPRGKAPGLKPVSLIALDSEA